MDLSKCKEQSSEFCKNFKKKSCQTPFSEGNHICTLVTPTILKHPKFDSNLSDRLSNDNPFAPTEKPSKNFKKFSENPKNSLENLNFPRNDFSFLSKKPDSDDSWIQTDSKAMKKFTENTSKPEKYLSKFNNSEISLKNFY